MRYVDKSLIFFMRFTKKFLKANAIKLVGRWARGNFPAFSENLTGRFEIKNVKICGLYGIGRLSPRFFSAFRRKNSRLKNFSSYNMRYVFNWRSGVFVQ